MTDSGTGRLDGKTALITGAASGMGAATARLFVAEGANVTIADLNEEAGDALAAELGPRTRFERVNVTVEGDLQGAIERTADAWGRLDCIFNNAGFGGALGPIDETSTEDFDITFDVLLKGVFLGIKHAAPIMKRQGSGSIISTASIAGLEAGWAPHLYSTAKSAVIALTRTVALEMAEWHVRVNCICPGLIATPLAVGRGFTGRSAAQLSRRHGRAAAPEPGRRGRRHRPLCAVARERRLRVRDRAGARGGWRHHRWPAMATAGILDDSEPPNYRLSTARTIAHSKQRRAT